MKKNVHVVPQGKQWAVKKEGAARASSLLPTQKEAIVVGRKAAQNEQSELVIHRQNGQIRDKDSFGNDPLPPRDRKH